MAICDVLVVPKRDYFKIGDYFGVRLACQKTRKAKM